MAVNGGYDAPFATDFEAAEPERTLVQYLSADDFLTEETAGNLVVPSLGICAGPPLGIIGQAYAGKTITAFSLGLSVATGNDLWGTWAVKQGVWLHLDYEQGKRHTKKRVRRLARGLGVSDVQLRDLIEKRIIRVSVFPELNLTTEGARDHFRREFEGVRLVTCDSLRMMLGGVDENSSQVRTLMQAITFASDATDAAAGVVHHGGKTPHEGSERARAEMGRGSSAIRDEFQGMLVMSKKKGDPVALVTHEKDRELGHEVADFGLRFEDVSEREDGSGDPKWGLRVLHVDRAQMFAKEAPKAKFDKVIQAVRDCIRDNPGIAGAEAIEQTIVGGSKPIRAAVRTLIASGEIVERRTGKGKGRRLYLSHMAPAEDA